MKRLKMTKKPMTRALMKKTRASDSLTAVHTMYGSTQPPEKVLKIVSIPGR